MQGKGCRESDEPASAVQTPESLLGIALASMEFIPYFFVARAGGWTLSMKQIKRVHACILPPRPIPSPAHASGTLSAAFLI